MNFKESYLIPKNLYDKQMQKSDVESFKERISNKDNLTTESNLPSDVKLKLWDFHQRYNVAPSQSIEDGINKKERQMGEILKSVNHTSKRIMAKDILDFIIHKTGGVVDWDDKFNLILNGRVYYNIDIRDCIRIMVGDLPNEDENKIRGLLFYLREFNIPSNLLTILKMGEKEEVPSIKDYGWGSDDFSYGVKPWSKYEDEGDDGEEEDLFLDASLWEPSSEKPSQKPREEMGMDVKTIELRGGPKIVNTGMPKKKKKGEEKNIANSPPTGRGGGNNTTGRGRGGRGGYTAKSSPAGRGGRGGTTKSSQSGRGGRGGAVGRGNKITKWEELPT